MSTPILVQDLETAFSVARRMADRATKQIVYDSESTGLDWRKDLIVGHVITFGPAPQDTYYVPLRHGPDHKQGNICVHPDRKDHPFELAMRPALARRDLHWVGHHFSFDNMFLFGHGMEIQGTMEDTEVGDALLDEYAASHSLEATCQHAGAVAKKGDGLYRYLAGLFGGNAERRAQMGNFWKLAGNDPIGFDYAAGDGVSTWSVLDKQIAAFDRQDMADIRKLESRVTRATVRMMKRGIKIDEARLAQIIEEVGGRLAKAKEVLPDGLNINSAPQLAKYFQGLGVDPASFTRTEKGNPSFDEEWLKARPEGKDVLVVRKFTGLLNTFLLPLRDRHVYNGRVHATFHQMANDDFGTITGRFSCSDPNLQQVHKRNKEIGSLVRSVFIPDDGLDWLDADLSQCLAAGTQVMVPGGTKNIEDLVPGDLVWSFDDDKRPVLRKVTWSGKTGTRKLYRLHWHTEGKTRGYLDATDDHQIRLYSGEYKSVDELLIMRQVSRHGIKVMAMRRTRQASGKSGYQATYLYTSGHVRYKEPRLILEELQGGVSGDVHHIDGDPSNNNPSNLLDINRYEHMRLHNSEKTGACNNHLIDLIEPLPGLHPVYDITVEGTHNFIANEICVHNCEPRLLAHYAQCKVLMAGYLSQPSVDAHSAVATAANIDRESGKRLNQTIITGGGKAKLISMLGANGADIYDAYFKAMPEVKKLQRESQRRLASRGYVTSLLGRRARLESHSKAYLAINRLLQCGNADIIKKAMVEIDEMFEAAGDECAILNTVHDALGMQGAYRTRDSHRELLLSALEKMTDFGPPGGERNYSVWLTVPMQADYGIGSNWAEATYPKEKLMYG